MVQTLDMAAQVESIATADGEEELHFIALVPEPPENPNGGPWFVKRFQVSMNGQSFRACPEQPPMKLEPLPPE